MTREHDALRDFVAPVALGAAAPHEVARVEAHAEECPVCREELARLRAAADLLALAVPQHEPSPELKRSLMATVRAEAQARAALEAPPPPPRRRPWRVRGLRAWPAAAVAAGLAAVALAVGLVVQSGTQGPGVRTIAVTGTAAAPRMSGRVVYVAGEDTAVVHLAHLRDLPPERAYQLWVIRGGVPRSAGLFESTGGGTARAVATGLSGAEGLAVTAQARANTTTPVPPILLTARL